MSAREARGEERAGLYTEAAQIRFARQGLVDDASVRSLWNRACAYV